MFDGVEARAPRFPQYHLKWRGNDRSKRGDAAVVFCVEASFPLVDWRGGRVAAATRRGRADLRLKSLDGSCEQLWRR
jgi:hypothetical protein